MFVIRKGVGVSGRLLIYAGWGGDDDDDDDD